MRRTLRILLALVLSVSTLTPVVSAQAPPTPLPGPSQAFIPVPPIQRATRASDKASPLIQAASDATDYGTASASDNFGGAWIDEKAKVAHVLLKDTPTVNASSVSPAISRSIRHPELVVYERAQYSRKELRTLQARVVADRTTLAGQGTNVVSVGEKTDANRLAVEVVSTTPTSVAAATVTLTRLYGTDTLIVKAVASAPQLADRNGPNPYRGGYSLNGTNGSACTLAFVGYTSTQWHVLTAGHCYGVGVGVSHTGIGSVGNVTINDFRNNSRVDIAAIPITGYGYQISKTLIRNDPNLANVDSIEGEQLTGKFVCKSGISTDQTCLYVSTVHVTVFFGSLSLQDQVIASGSANSVIEGDSGGPVYHPNNQTSVSAEGIVSAKNADGSQLYYSFVANAIPDDGLSVNTSVNGI